MLSTLEHIVLWIAAGGMGVGALAIASLSIRSRTGERHHFVIGALVCAIAFCAYFAMANRYGQIELRGHQEFFARYIDWSFTTPLLIGGLLLVALPPRSRAGAEARDRNGLIFGAVAADILMILTGLCAALTGHTPVRYGFYAISCVFFFVVLAVLWGPARLAAQGQGSSTGRLYVRLASALTTLWCVYPIVWLLGNEGIGVMGDTLELIIIAGVDLCAKVLYGFALCAGVLANRGAASEGSSTTTGVNVTV